MWAIFAVLLTAVSGAIGWWVTHFVLLPVRRLEELRTKAQEEVIFYGNIGINSDKAEVEAAYLALRRIAVGFIAIDQTSSWLLKKWAKWQKYDLNLAGSQIISLANSLSGTFTYEQRVLIRSNIDNAIRLRHTYSIDDVLAVKNRLQIPASNAERRMKPLSNIDQSVMAPFMLPRTSNRDAPHQT